MNSAWWTPEQAAWIGAIAGSTAGMIGGTLGLLMSIFARRGTHKTFLLTSCILVFVVGLASLIAGLVALLGRQPYHVWYPLILLGGITTVVIGSQISLIWLRFRNAELRRLEAELLRRG